MPQQYKIGSHKTSVFTDKNGFTNVVYHSTCVVKFNDKKTVLDSGGWRTATTKTRINQTANQFNLNFQVSQNKGEWFVNGLLFYDNIELDRKGKVISKVKQSNLKQITKIKTRIKKYCDLITKDNLPLPDNGDCWNCALHEEKTGKPMGDLNRSGHLEQHLKEKYLHGSILINAMREAGFKDDQIGFHYSLKLADTFKRSVRKYLTKRLISNIAV